MMSSVVILASSRVKNYAFIQGQSSRLDLDNAFFRPQRRKAVG